MLGLRVPYGSAFVRVLGMGLLLNGAACSVLVDSSRQQCSTDTDCTQRGGDFASSVCVESMCRTSSPPNAAPDASSNVSPDSYSDARWTCLGKSWSAPPPGASPVTVTLDLKDLVTNQPIAGVSARICRKLDVACADPVLSDLQSDAAGKLIAHVPWGFDGYAELAPTKAMPGIYFFYPPLTEDREIPLVPILSLAALSTFAAIVGTQILPERGQVLLGTYDCHHAPAEGVRLSSADADAGSAPFYMVRGMPSTTETQTDGQGYGGILNLRPGAVTISGQLVATAQDIGTESLLTRAGTITYTALLPLSAGN